MSTDPSREEDLSAPLFFVRAKRIDMDGVVSVDASQVSRDRAREIEPESDIFDVDGDSYGFIRVGHQSEWE